MSVQRRIGPLQLLLIGFETTERFRGDVIHELLGLRGRGAPEAAGAIEALTTAALLESATVEAAIAEAEDAVARSARLTVRRARCRGASTAAARACPRPARARG
jgi:hypothetical protein